MLGTPRRADSNLAVQRALSDKVKALLAQATELDARGEAEAALRVYQQGRHALESALALSFAPSERLAAEAEEAKLLACLVMVDERVGVLRQQVPGEGWASSVFGSRKSVPPTPQPDAAQPHPHPQPHPHHPQPHHPQPHHPQPHHPQPRPQPHPHPQPRPHQPPLPPRAHHVSPADVRVRGAQDSRPGGAPSPVVPSSPPPIKGVSKEMQHRILDEVVDSSPGVSWDDIAGLEQAKQAIQEIIIYPSLRPDLFTGLRSPPKGVLLYGPPGTGKTMLAKAIATESKMVFFSISASSLMSKWVGDGEKMVRALFAVARHLQPAVIFIDEIDSMLGQRSDNENDAARRVKTEFLVQFDGAATTPQDRLLVLGATNTPWTLDEAARRRLAKRIYIPLPDGKAREAMLRHMLRDQKLGLSDAQWGSLIKSTDGYSGSDLRALCGEAVMGPVRELGRHLVGLDANDLRATSAQDFEQAMGVIRPSVSQSTLARYEDWSDQFGTRGA